MKVTYTITTSYQAYDERAASDIKSYMPTRDAAMVKYDLKQFVDSLRHAGVDFNVMPLRRLATSRFNEFTIQTLDPIGDIREFKIEIYSHDPKVAQTAAKELRQHALHEVYAD